MAGDDDGETLTMFPCSSCGACCRRVGYAPQFPRELVRPDGSCVNLNGNLCDIYAERPDVCRVDKMIETHDLDRSEAYAATARLCNQWMEEDGVEASMRITLPVLNNALRFVETKPPR